MDEGRKKRGTRSGERRNAERGMGKGEGGREKRGTLSGERVRENAEGRCVKRGMGNVEQLTPRNRIMYTDPILVFETKTDCH